ncbi:hypothetical protein T492DRAFT_937135 [Pavlovales sp. CCMP2436]|nr:hypothetical protein T492DRAFT_937135 [Pavlovales sp. CCMP2436]|mmetsp:Transcript_12022/g.30266  ORF Transcript_12022/g.30266 Transcript_12022/m.30266 type:complete len:207 (-) Transcript_12022:101-721(-)
MATLATWGRIDVGSIEIESLDGVRRTCRVPSEDPSVGALRRCIAEQWGWPWHRVVVVLAGKLLDDDGAPLRDVGLPSTEAVVRCWLASPREPGLGAKPGGVNDGGVGATVAAARDLLAWAKSVGARFWLGVLMWLASAKLAGRMGFGNPYILLSMFVLVFSNLGQRRAGELSAYNVFNEGHQELLGQLRPEHLEADLIDPNRLAER